MQEFSLKKVDIKKKFNLDKGISPKISIKIDKKLNKMGKFVQNSTQTLPQNSKFKDFQKTLPNLIVNENESPLNDTNDLQRVKIHYKNNHSQFETSQQIQ